MPPARNPPHVPSRAPAMTCAYQATGEVTCGISAPPTLMDGKPCAPVPQVYFDPEKSIYSDNASWVTSFTPTAAKKCTTFMGKTICE